MTKQEALATKV